ncbi:BFH_collapsed_G0021290.mRNA.1.CDS.1 [Saccharomyces cerevisiae]|nr:BFH_collapsed_G0021290.mRNA.1.CDS.1 [Saccharomyces cerevisiae]
MFCTVSGLKFVLLAGVSLLIRLLLRRYLHVISSLEEEKKFDANMSLCQTLNLSSFDANADLANYEGPKLEFEQLYDDKNAFKGAKII